MIVWSSQPWKKNLLFRFFETDAKFYRVSINDCLVKPALEKKFTVPLF
jgi:hypothetical protein